MGSVSDGVCGETYRGSESNRLGRSQGATLERLQFVEGLSDDTKNMTDKNNAIVLVSNGQWSRCLSVFAVG
jgi:hypothetical protein